MRYEQYSFCKSKAGHDKNTIYIIIKEEGEYVYVVDGKYKKLESPKKKNKKHIEWISSIYNVCNVDGHITDGYNVNDKCGGLRDEDIRKAIKLYKNQI